VKANGYEIAFEVVEHTTQNEYFETTVRIYQLWHKTVQALMANGLRYVTEDHVALEFQANKTDSEYRKAGTFYGARFQWLSPRDLEFTYRLMKKLSKLEAIDKSDCDLKNFINSLRLAGIYEIERGEDKIQRIVAKGFQKLQK